MKRFFIIISITLLCAGCGKEQAEDITEKDRNYKLFTHGSIPIQEYETNETIEEKEEKTVPYSEELDFEVENKTNKTVFVTCFSYIQKEPFTRWRWDKSPIYKLEANQNTIINIDTIPDQEHREHIFGYLAVFENEKEAHDAIYELTNDRNKIDLDIIYKLKNKKVVIGIEKYGFKPAKFDVRIKNDTPPHEEELDFVVENQTGKAIFVTSFAYQLQDNIHRVWEYDKSAVHKLEPGQASVINVSTIDNKRDKDFMYGHLAIFDETEEQEAHDSTYELLEPSQRLALGKLSRLAGKKVVLGIEKYGSLGKITEFDLQQHLPSTMKSHERVVAMIDRKKIKKKKEITPKPKKQEEKKALPHKNNGSYQFFS